MTPPVGSSLLLSLAVVILSAVPAGAATIVVDQRSSSCSDAGPGTPANPYCTISAAVAAHTVAGNTIEVRPGVYREQVTIPNSGTAARPFVLRALPGPGDPVVVNGAADLANPALWTPYQGDVWRAAGVTWSPVQVFRGSVRLTAWSGDPAQTPVNGFRYVAGSGLYVNAGGGNPGAQPIEAGRRPYGILVSNRAHVVLEGFTIARAEDRGVQLTNGTNAITVAGCTVTESGRFGIQVNGGTAVRLADNRVFANADHGISVIAGASGGTIERNESFANGSPGRAANGLFVFGAPNHLVRANRLHDNQDSGLQLSYGANDNLLIHNVAWNNGDHGFDHLQVTGNRHIGGVAHGNYRDGYSFEGNAHGQAMHNCITTDNGLTTNRFDLWVDDSSSVGFTSDDNLIWNSTAQAPIRYRTTVYASVAAFSAASGGDTRSLQADPRFAAPASGDFHLTHGSPAIDNANSSVPGWSAQDAEGNSRGDDPYMPNRGLGPITVADRGAYEYTAGGVVSVSAAESRAGAAAVAPNPVRSTGRLEFTLVRPGPLRVGVYDLRGRLVMRLRDGEEAPAGRHTLALDAAGGGPLGDGVYFYRIESVEGARGGRFIVARDRP